MSVTQKLYQKAKTVIPGGTQLLSKRPEMFMPNYWPAYYQKAKGCQIWDLDGNKYIDMSYMGIGANVLGYADPDVNQAVKKVIDNGSMSTLNAQEEVKLAELLIKMHPWAEMVRFARSGGEAMALAVRIARAYSGKDKVLFCGYHGWHDWYLAANLADDAALDGHLLPGLEPNGVPRALKGSAIPFHYNDLIEFQTMLKLHLKDIGAIVMEPIRTKYPDENFLTVIRKAASEHNIPFIFDEVSSGFRIANGGAHLKLGVNPDIAVFSKALGNGFPIAAIIGKKKIMQAAQTTFISSTMWTERIGPTAAIATIQKYKKEKVAKHLQTIGKLVQKGWALKAKKNNLPIKVSGIYPLSHFDFDHKQPLVMKTLFTQLMLEEGFLASTVFYASFAHKEEHVEKYLAAVERSYKKIAEIYDKNQPEKYLKGPICHSGFARLA